MSTSYTYKKYPYRVEFPDSSERGRSCQSLEDALQEARWNLHRVWKEGWEGGKKGEPTTDAETAVITNRNTGYRWILRRSEFEVEFETPEMVEETVGNQQIGVFLTVEEAEALARTAKAADIKDRRTRALADQALDQIAEICRRVQDRVRAGDQTIDRWARSIPHRPPRSSEVEQESQTEEEFQAIETPRPRYRPLGDPDNLSLKEAGEILGKAMNTVYLWYRQGKFPPAVDVGPYLHESKPVIVVPHYRLEAWLAGERMPSILEEVFDRHGLREPPWRCWTAKKGAARVDIEFWVKRRGWSTGVSKGDKRIYGEGLEDGKVYEIPDAGT